MSVTNNTENKRKDKKKLNQVTSITEKLNLALSTIRPLTDNQQRAFQEFGKNKNLVLHGVAGTGKTFLSLYLTLKELFSHGEYEKLYIVRSVVPTRSIGFLPGSDQEKIGVYEDPYHEICQELLGRGDAYELLKQKKIVEFISTSFIRGTTFNNCLVVVDEIQNMDWGELSSIITRVGKNCRIIFSGDFRQSDFRGKEVSSKKDCKSFMDVLRLMSEDFSFVEFEIQDIVRSDLVKSFIIQASKMGLM